MNPIKMPSQSNNATSSFIHLRSQSQSCYDTEIAAKCNTRKNSKAVVIIILLSLFANILVSPVVVCQTVNRPAEVSEAACGAVKSLCSARFVAIPGASTVKGRVVPVVLGV